MREIEEKAGALKRKRIAPESIDEMGELMERAAAQTATTLSDRLADYRNQIEQNLVQYGHNPELSTIAAISLPAHSLDWHLRKILMTINRAQQYLAAGQIDEFGQTMYELGTLNTEAETFSLIKPLGVGQKTIDGGYKGARNRAEQKTYPAEIAAEAEKLLVDGRIPRGLAKALHDIGLEKRHWPTSRRHYERVVEKMKKRQ